MTYLRCWEGALYFAFVIDVFSRRAIGGSSPPTCEPISSSMHCGWRSGSARAVLTSSWWHTPIAVPNTAPPTTPRNSTTGVLASVGSVGDAYDNAMAESFVDTFKTELIADRVWRSRSRWSWPSLSTSPGSTTTVCMNAWVISHPQSPRTYTLLGEVN